MITLAATPLGNDDDASPRLRRALQEAELIAAEDTRRLRSLAQRLGIKISAQVIPYHDHNEEKVAPKLVATAAAGTDILMVSDAGMPVVSDPGYRLVKLAAAAGIPVQVIPGPSAALTALALSGLPSNRFTFFGFLPRKAGERSRVLNSLAALDTTWIFFESPRRVAATLADLAAAFGEKRPAALCRELTKTHEEVCRGTLADLQQRAAVQEILGEVTLVVAGCPEKDTDISAAVLEEVQELHALGLRLKDAASYVAKHHNLRANEIYERALDN